MPVTPSGPPSPASRLSPVFAALRGAVTGFVAAWALEALYLFLGTNVHVVAPGYVYRSAQLGPGDLGRVVARYHVRTVLNLCGCCDPLPWYQEESRDTCALGICQEDVSFSACRLPSVQGLRRLVEVLDRCDYPVLIHCHRGIDRTGMASTLALLLHTDATLPEARRQLGLRYGHLAWGHLGNVDRLFDLYQEWLTAHNETHSPATLRRWVENDYCPGECRAAVELLEPRDLPLRAAPSAPLGFRVRCTNTSVKPWVLKPGSNTGVHAGWTVFDERDQYVREGRSGMFDDVVAPGDHIDLTLAMPPLPAGRYSVQVDMVDEQHAWFYMTGATEPVTFPLEVR